MKPSERAEAEILADMNVLPQQQGGEADIYQRIETAMSTRQRVQIEEARFADDIFSMLNGASGQRVAQALRQKFVEVELFDADPLKMAAAVAEHDFVVRLLQLAESAQRNKVTHLEKQTDG